MSATLTGSIFLNDDGSPFIGVLQFWPIQAPAGIAGSGVFSGAVTEVETGENGSFTVDLRPGVFAVEWRVRGIKNRGLFEMTTSDAVLEDIIVVAGNADGAISRDTSFADVAEFKASTTTAQLVWVNALGPDADQDGGFFRRGGTPTGTADINFIVRTDGQTYTRIAV